MDLEYKKILKKGTNLHFRVGQFVDPTHIIAPHKQTMYTTHLEVGYFKKKTIWHFASTTNSAHMESLHR